MTINSSNRIGILGGTFNPVHLGHLALANSAIEAFNLSKVLFIPCSKPPHKTSKVLASARHRLAMLKLAIKGDPRFEISDVEIKRGGPSYTIDTITQLKRTSSDGVEYYFIIGADSLLELHTWKKVHKLLKLCKFVTFGRPGVNTHKLKRKDLKLDPPWPEKLLRHVDTGRLLNISSSDIRHRVAEGLSIRYLTPNAVAVYIADHNLYAKQ